VLEELFDRQMHQFLGELLRVIFEHVKQVDSRHLLWLTVFEFAHEGSPLERGLVLNRLYGFVVRQCAAELRI
jgi:hypothetical protein